MNEDAHSMHAGVELELYAATHELAPPLEWPDTTRLELSTSDGILLFWRDDARAVGAGRWWFSGIPRCALTWAELYDAYGEALNAAVPLYPPNTGQVAVRPMHVLLSQNQWSMHAWCFTDGDDARAAHDAGIGQTILPSVLLAPGVALEPVTFYTGWARVGRDGDGDLEPHIMRSADSWAAPGVHIPSQRTGDDMDGLAQAGVDVLDLWCVGPDVEEVLTDLNVRYARSRSVRETGAWRPAGDSATALLM